MNCPVDGTQLTLIDHHGVEIDCCPSCRGVWLDRERLDEIVDRASGDGGGNDGDGDERGGTRRRGRRGFLSDLLDLGG